MMENTYMYVAGRSGLIKYELSVQLQYEKYHAEIDGELPKFEQ